MPAKNIISKENSFIRKYLQLRDKKKFRQEEQAFVIEGLRIVQDALQKPEQVQQIFCTETALKKYSELLLFQQQKIIQVSDALGKLMSDTEHTQGVFAVCRMPEQQAEISPSGKYLVLCQLQDPGNMGMILRTCDALGIEGVLFTECCDVYNPKTIRATMGSIFRVPMFFGNTPEELLHMLNQLKIISYASVPDKNALPLTSCQFHSGCAVWVGNEGNGLPEEIISSCQKTTIPMRGGAESLNAAMAAGILLWEILR